MPAARKAKTPKKMVSNQEDDNVFGRLVAIKPNGQFGSCLILRKDLEYTIGSAPECIICIQGDDNIAALDSKLFFDKSTGQPSIENYLTVNSTEIVTLLDPDTIEIGSKIFKFEAKPKDPTPEPSPEKAPTPKQRTTRTKKETVQPTIRETPAAVTEVVETTPEKATTPKARIHRPKKQEPVVELLPPVQEVKAPVEDIPAAVKRTTVPEEAPTPKTRTTRAKKPKLDVEEPTVQEIPEVQEVPAAVEAVDSVPLVAPTPKARTARGKKQQPVVVAEVEDVKPPVRETLATKQPKRMIRNQGLHGPDSDRRKRLEPRLRARRSA